MWACNYDFARDNSHSSDLNVVSFCEDNILMRFFLFISTEIELFIYTREIAPPPPRPHPPSSPHSCLGDLGGWHALSSRRQEQRTRRITGGCGSSLKSFRGLSISSVSYKSENKVSAGRDAELIR